MKNDEKIILKNKPAKWRKGQTLFNFLEFIRSRGYPNEQSVRMADVFNIPDEELEKLWEDFTK